MAKDSLMKMIPSKGDLIEIISSHSKDTDGWSVISENGQVSHLNPGESGIIVEKTPSNYEETYDHFDYKILIDGVLYEDVSDNMFIVKSVNPR